MGEGGHDGAGGRVVVRAGPSPRSARTATGLLLVEMRILHSRMTVGTAPSSAKRASRRPGAPAAASARLAAPLPGTRGGAGCPNLLQRPESHQDAGG